MKRRVREKKEEWKGTEREKKGKFFYYFIHIFLINLI